MPDGPHTSISTGQPDRIGSFQDPYLRDVYRQPELLRRLAGSFADGERQRLADVRQWFWRSEHHLIVFTGTGPSLFAAQAVIPILNKIGIRAVALEVSEVVHHAIPSLAGKVAVVIVSETGEEPEVRALVAAIKGRVAILGVVSTPGSFLAATADLVVTVPVEAESDTGVLPYSGTVAVLRLLAHVLAGGVVDQVTASLTGAADSIDRFVERGPAALEPAARAVAADSLIYLVGTGPSAASAEEGARLLKCIARRQAEPVLPGHLAMGGMDLPGADRVVIAFALDGPALQPMRDVMERLAAGGNRVIAVGNPRPGELPDGAIPLRVTYPDSAVAPLVEIVPVQLMAHRLRAGSGI